jgi:hypothetical protein
MKTALISLKGPRVRFPPAPPFGRLKQRFQTAGTPYSPFQSPGLEHDWSTIYQREEALILPLRGPIGLQLLRSKDALNSKEGLS